MNQAHTAYCYLDHLYSSLQMPDKSGRRWDSERGMWALWR